MMREIADLSFVNFVLVIFTLPLILRFIRSTEELFPATLISQLLRQKGIFITRLTAATRDWLVVGSAQTLGCS